MALFEITSGREFTFTFVLLSSETSTVAPDFVIINSSLSAILTVPILSMSGILFTSVVARQDNGGTKNIPWFFSAVVPPILWKAYTFSEVLA